MAWHVLLSNGSQVPFQSAFSSCVLEWAVGKDLASLHPPTSVWKTLGRPSFILESLVRIQKRWYTTSQWLCLGVLLGTAEYMYIGWEWGGSGGEDRKKEGHLWRRRLDMVVHTVTLFLSRSRKESGVIKWKGRRLPICDMVLQKKLKTIFEQN